MCFEIIWELVGGFAYSLKTKVDFGLKSKFLLRWYITNTC
jgi:hypothetical protein